MLFLSFCIIYFNISKKLYPNVLLTRYAVVHELILMHYTIKISIFPPYIYLDILVANHEVGVIILYYSNENIYLYLLDMLE